MAFRVHCKSAPLTRSTVLKIKSVRRDSRVSISRTATTQLSRPPSSTFRVSTVFTSLLILGVGTTAYGIYEFYSTFTMWPEEVRGDLRAAVKAKHQGDMLLSERYFRKAWQTAQSMPVASFAPTPYLKLSGIAVSLAEILETADRPEEAYEVYAAALAQIQSALVAQVRNEGSSAPEKLTGPERMRGVAIASKLGEMADLYQQPEEEEERWLVWAVEALLRTMSDSSNRNNATGDVSVLSDLELPRWATKTDVGAPLHALGAFYAKKGNVEYAIPLYLNAISVLLPPPTSSSQPSVEDRCRGAEMMNSLAALLVDNATTPEKLKQAELWAQQAHAVIQKSQAIAAASGKPTSDGIDLCEQALSAVLFNLGSLAEMQNRRAEAREMYVAAASQAKSAGMREGIVQAQGALRRIDRVLQAGTALE